MEVAESLSPEKKAGEVIQKETDGVKDGAESLRRNLTNKMAATEIAESPGPIRTLFMARMVEEFRTRPVVINIHSCTTKERITSINFLSHQTNRG